MVMEILREERARVLIPLMGVPKNQWELMQFYYSLEEGNKKNLQRSKSGRFKKSVLMPLEARNLLLNAGRGKEIVKKRHGKKKKPKKDRRLVFTDANVELILKEWLAYFLSHNKHVEPEMPFLIEKAMTLRKELFSLERLDPLLNLDKRYDLNTKTWQRLKNPMRIKLSLFGYIGMCLVFASMSERFTRFQNADKLTTEDRNLVAIIKQALWRCVRRDNSKYSEYDFHVFFDTYSEKVLENYRAIFSYDEWGKSLKISPAIHTALAHFSYRATEIKNGQPYGFYSILYNGIKVRKNLKELYDQVNKEWKKWQDAVARHNKEMKIGKLVLPVTDGDSLKQEFGISQPFDKETRVYVEVSEFLDLYPAFDAMIEKFM